MEPFEERLRQGLRARASDVRADPTLWDRIERRAARRRLAAWVAPAGAAAAVVAALVVVLPGTFAPDEGVELTPGDAPAEDDGRAPGEDGREAPEESPEVDGAAVSGLPLVDERAGAVVFADDGVVAEVDLESGEGEPVGGADWAGGEIAVRPGRSADQLAIAAADDPLCGERVAMTRRRDDALDTAELRPGGCVGTPVFSPDGGHLAWVEDAEDEPVLTTARINQGVEGEEAITDGATRWRLGEVATPLRATAWVAVDGADWRLLLIDGEQRLHALPTERQSDGAVTVPSDAPDLGEATAVTDAETLAAAPADPFEPDAGGIVVLERAGTGIDDAEDPGAVLGVVDVAGEREFSGDLGTLDTDLDPHGAWVSAAGRDVLAGDGEGQVWHAALPAEGAEAREPELLEAEWAAATLLPDGPEPDEAPEEEAEDAVRPVGAFAAEPDEGEGFPSTAGEPALLTDVRLQPHDRFDRVVLEFEGEERPTHRVAATEPPVTEAGRGEEIDVDGEALVAVDVAPASGFDVEAGEVRYDGPERLVGEGAGAVREVVRSGDFESHLTWVLGLEAETGWAVTWLSDPLRLVIDIEAPAG